MTKTKIKIKHDKYNNPIYIGDVVKTKYGRLCKIVWRNTNCFIGCNLEPLEYEHKAPDKWDLWCSENLEVVENNEVE